MKSINKLFNRQLSVTLLVFMLINMISCSFFESFDEDSGGSSDTPSVSINSLTLAKSSLNMKVGSMDYVALNIKPQGEQKNLKLKWSYDESIIECDTSSNWGVTIKALKEGQTNLKCSYDGFDSTCIITVSGYEVGYEKIVEPYIYSNSTILQIKPDVTEKVFVSLYGGGAGDIDGYTWTVDNNSVASLQPTGQYCLVTAKQSGYARIKVTHQKASYPYYIGVYVFADETDVTYITTQNNILTMNQGDSAQTINVSLVNGKKNSTNNFSWEIVDAENGVVPVGVDWNGSNAVITPLKSGCCTLRITHPDAIYPLDILCRVITIVKNVYIQPDSVVVTLNGDEHKTINCNLENIKDGEYSIDDYEYRLDNYNAASIVNSVGSSVTVSGKANGSCKLIISHPKSAYTREVLLIVTGQLTDAVDASCYITTSQNYIRTKVGAEAVPLSISLRGGEDGDETGFVWSVKSTPVDGYSDVIKLETTHGTANYSRAAIANFTDGKAYITPQAEGTAVITITHPKIVYPTEVLVKVLSADAILEEPLYFAGSGLIKVLNGESYDYTIELKGKNKVESDNGNIRWSTESNLLSISANGNKAHITAPALGTGCTTSFITASHSKCDADKKILVMTADDLETLNSMKAIYSDKLYYNIEKGKTANLIAQPVGFEEDDEIDENDNVISYAYSAAQWTIGNPSILSLDKDSKSPMNVSVTGLKVGSTTVTVSYKGVSCIFTVTVYPEGSVHTEPEVYFTTSQNVMIFGNIGKTSTVNISAINLPSSEYHNISWSSDNENVASVIGNGTNATITSNGEGTAVLSISHPDSQNTLKIYVRVGSEYVIPDSDPIVYISSNDVITMLKDSPVQQLQAALVNYTGNSTSGFSFSIDNEKVATISAQTANGIAYIKPVSSGQAQITISHTATEITKQVLVMVGNSQEELSAFTYLTTGQNVVALGEGTTKNIAVSVKNSEGVVLDGYSWVSSNPSVVDVTSSGASAVLTGNSIGTAMITVTNSKCKYPLTIIAQCVDPIAAAANPYIQLTSSVLTLNVSSTYTNVTADLVGGNESDFSDFIWTSNDSSICAVFGQNEIGKLRALKEGTTYITVSHPKAAYSSQILVVCDKKIESECYISVPSSIINMKPNDAGQSITANLINGNQTDKYNFSWSLDVYDVIDFQYSANVCTITPKQSGSCTITLSHPKAAYDQQIIVNVQEYTNFAFPNQSMTITQGDTRFITMQVPVTNVTTHIAYYVGDPKNNSQQNSILTIQGTKTTAQITAVSSGTTTVTAKLIATSTGVVQAESEMMVYVKEKPVDTVFITSSSTVYTVNKGKSQTLSATLSGKNVIQDDNSKLKWSTSDNDIIQIAGISSDGTVIGNQIYITALKSGEAIITCSHEKANSDLQFYVVVPGTAEKVLSLNKTYVSIVKGSSGTQIKAKIENAESNNEYYDIDWSIADASGNGKDIARIMGSGQTVTIYPVSAGEAILTATLEGCKPVKCNIIVENTKSFVFEEQSKRILPKHSARIKYTVSPPDAYLTWTTSQQTDCFEFIAHAPDIDGNGYVEIVGLENEGSGVINCVTDSGAKGTINVRVAWDYKFTVTGETNFTIHPGESRTVEYAVCPEDAEINLESTDKDVAFSYTIKNKGDGKGEVTINAIQEAPQDCNINLVATNPNNFNEVIGSKTIKARIKYLKLTPLIKIASSDGKYSIYNDDAKTLNIGDGENLQMSFTIKETAATASIRQVEWEPKRTGLTISRKSTSGNGVIYTVSQDSDVIIYDYRIDSLLVPYRDGMLLDFRDFTWAGYTHSGSDGRYDYFGLCYKPDWGNRDTYGYKIRYYALSSYSFNQGSSYQNASYGYSNPLWYYVNYENDYKQYIPRFTLKEDTTWRNRVLTESEFKSYAWFYCPGTPNVNSGDSSDILVTYNDFVTGKYSPGSYGKGCLVSEDEREMTRNVQFTRVPTTDTGIKKTEELGNLVVTINHNGNDETLRIKVYCDTRYCTKN